MALRLTMVTLLGTLAFALPAPADDAVLTLRASTLQGASAAATVVLGGPFICFYGCSGTAGFVLEGEAGLAGVKGAVGVGLADRTDGTPVILTVKAAVLRSWGTGLMAPADAVFVGPEIEFAERWGVTIGAFKRVDGREWRLSAGVVRAF